jgi:hypothetical protein
MFRDYDTAKETAKSVAAELAAGGSDVLMFSGKERPCYERAMETLRPLHMDLDTAIIQFAEAVKTLNGAASLGEAAKHYVRQHSTNLPVKSVRDVVDELLDEKTKAGVSVFHWKDLRSRLTHFANAFHCPLTSVTAAEIQQFLVSLGLGFRSRRNYRQSIVTLFNFAKAHRYLKPDHPGISGVPKVPKRGPKISIFSPDEMTTLLSGAKSELIPALALGAFAGIRTEEIKRLRWSHLKLARGLIDVPSEVTKTQSRRLIPKRGLSMKIEEWLLAGEYILANENPNLMFCERGIRTFETYTRNTLDLGTIPIIKKESHCPIVIDPSQGAGRADLVVAMCKGAVVMGADALLIEVHPNPAEAWSDGAQQVSLDVFAKLMRELRPLILAAGRE